MEPTHAIFQGPREVSIEFEEREKPYDYFIHPGMKRMGETIKVWPVQKRSFPEIDPGLVSNRERFIHTENAEVISGGINGKGPDSVAIGRHGNFLLWGFYASPSDMTDSAKTVFVNAICYVQQFDGQIPSELRQENNRRVATLKKVYSLRTLSDEYLDKLVEKFVAASQEHPVPDEVKERMGDDPKAYYRDAYKKYADENRQQIPESVRQKCNDDVERLIAFYEANYEYLRGYEVDEEAQFLGLSNREVQSVEACIQLLDDEQRAEAAITFLNRYTQEDLDDVDAWKAWWDRHGSRLRYDPAGEKFVCD